MGVTAASPARSRRPRLLAASYSAGAQLMRVVPARLRYAAAVPGGTAWFWLSPAQRKAALVNYATATGRDHGDPEVTRVARRAFQNYGRMLIDFLLLGSLTAEELLARFTVQGVENLDAAIARGRGVILALPHMGSWDVAAAYASARGYAVSAVAERFPGSLNDAVVASRGRFGMEIIPMGRAAIRGISAALQANRIVALLCDLEQGPGVSVRFFGRSAVVPAGPAAIALKTGAALLPAYVYSTGPGRYVGVVEEWLPRSEDESRESLAQKVIDRFELFIREHPDQWYAFRPMFTR